MTGLSAQIRGGDELKAKGNEAYKAKKFDEALSLYDQAIAANPNDMIYYNNKAAVYMELGEYDKAVQQLTDVLNRRYEINGANKEGATFEKVGKVMTRIAACLAKQKKFEEAKQMFERALTEDNNRVTRNALRDMETEREIYEKESYRDLAKSEEHRTKGNEFFKAQQWAEAKKEYDEAIKRNPDDARIYSNRAGTLTKLLAYPDALSDLTTCLKLDPTFVKAYSRRGTIHFFTKEYNKALEDYDNGLKIDPTNQECLKGKESVLSKVREGQHGGADEEQVQRAMQDPEIQKILSDPKINQVLKDMQENPQSGMAAIQGDPQIMAAMQKLIVAGILKVGKQ